MNHATERPFEMCAGNVRIREISTASDVYRKPDRVIVAEQEGLIEIQAMGAVPDDGCQPATTEAGGGLGTVQCP